MIKRIQNFSRNQQLAELRDWLLPMLMNGEVRVPHSLGEEKPKRAYDKVEVMLSGVAAEDAVKYK